MDWSCLGHAMWLVEAAGLRLLCDPLLEPEHHGGVFEMVPRRTVNAAALFPDFVLVSHRHPDHFDVPSLHRLARLDPDAVVVTPDTLVAWAARAVGFRTVHMLPPGQQVQLEGVRLVTTPSLGADEWGVVVAADGAVVWNQVDAVLRDVDHVRQVLSTVLPAVGAPAVDLALARWQPMLEIAATLGRRTSFPYADYGELLAQVAAIRAHAVVPSANGAAHVQSFRWLDRFVFPVSEARFLRDVPQVSPGTTAFPLRVGGRYRVRAGSVTLQPRGAADLVDCEPGGADPRDYRPFAIPELSDPNLGGHDEALMRPRVDAWICETLAAGLAKAWPSMGVQLLLRFGVEVVFPRACDRFTVHVGPDGARVVKTLEPDWDLINVVAGSMLWEVLEGRRHWGDVLLAGGLRAATRAYAVDEAGLRPASVGETFLYYGLSYDDAVERAVRWQVESLTQSRAAKK
ncbi:MAG: MBL fold metallo-hydrolase [Deltaproteobacteria bacterium]|nr:MBL fold metallo-hydrolase [Deltaproteobacteria bacterium]